MRKAATAAVAVVAMLIPAARTIQGWISRIGAPVTWDYGPAQLAVRVDLYARGVALYRDFRVPPYIPLVYGPVIPWLTAPFARYFGSGPLAALEAGRIITIISTLVICALIFVLARKSNAGAAAATLAALAFMMAPIVQRWGFDYRVDTPALACELGGIAAFAAGLSIPALALFAITFFIKQGRIAGIAAVVLYCWLSGSRRRAFTLAVAWLLIVASGITILAMVFPWYWLNSFAALGVNHYDLGAAILWLAVLAGGNPALVVLAALAILRRRANDRLMLCYLGFAIVENFASSIRWGSNAYYFIPSLAAVAVVAAGGIEMILRRARVIRPALGAAAGAVIALGLLAGYLVLAPAIRGMTLAAVIRPSIRCAVILPQPWDSGALARLGAISGPILTDDAGICLVDPRTNLEWIDLMVLGAMRSRGNFDDSQLLAQIRGRRIAAFALDADGLGREFRGRPLFWPELRAAIEQNYRIAAAPGPPYLMLPDAAPSRGAGSQANR
ncbi:MAG: hypothetical protein ACREQR_08455 [Candidatus Binataceae bacterium]